MADEHVLSNQMIAMPGTDNLPFAMKLITTLKGDAKEVRNKAYFFEYGEQKFNFDDVKFGVNPSPPMPPLPIPPPQVIDQLGTQIADGMIDQVDRNDTINRLISQNQNFYARLIAVVSIVIVSLIALFLAKRMFFSQYRKDRTALPIDPLARIKPAKGLVGQMRQDVLMAGDYGPMIREYLRELFGATGLPTGSHDRLPAVQYKGKAENAPALLADLTKLWTLAYGPSPHVKIADWKNIEPT